MNMATKLPCNVRSSEAAIFEDDNDGSEDDNDGSQDERDEAAAKEGPRTI